MIKRPQRRAGQTLMRVAVGLWIIAVISQFTADGPLFPAATFGLAVGAFFAGSWLARPGRKNLIAARSSAVPVVAAYMDAPSPVTVEDAIFEFSVRGAPVLVWKEGASLGADRRWRLKISRRRASVVSDREVLATARRLSKKGSRWVITAAGMEYHLSTTLARRTSRTKSSKHLWGKDTQSVLRRRSVLSLTTDGAPVATIDLTYEVAAELIRRIDADRHMNGRFSGEIDPHNPVPVPVAVLGLRLSLGRWAKKAPKTGEWTEFASAGA